MNVTVIAPHPDDECIGCGGSVQLHADRGDDVSVVFLTSGEYGLKEVRPEEARRIREEEASAAAHVLGIRKLHFLRQRDWFLAEDGEKTAAALAPLLRQLQPALIYCPHEHDWHPDHKAAFVILRQAISCFDGGRAAEIRCYEVWTPLEYFHHVQDISTVMADKIRALRSHRSQFKELDYAQAVEGLNLYRGAIAGRCKYAEVFADPAK